MKGPESKLRDKVTAWLEAQPDVWHFKVVGSLFQRRGVPDIIGEVRGLFFGFELKAKAGKQTPQQKLEEAKIRRAGGVCVVIRSLEEARNVVASLRALRAIEKMATG